MSYGIQQVCHALPNTVISSESISADTGMDLSFLQGKLGISSRHILGPDESLQTLAEAAVTNLLSSSGLETSEVDILVVISQTTEVRIPHLSAVLHGRFSLPKSTITFDIGLGCSGYVAGLQIVKSLLREIDGRNAILVTADAYSRILDRTDRNTYPLFGDAATATLISKSGTWTFGSFESGTDGQNSDALQTKFDPETSPDGLLSMDGRRVYSFVLRQVIPSIREALNRNNVSLQDVDRFVFHQANRFMLETISKELHLSASQLVEDLDTIGNTTSSSIPIAFQRNVLHSREDLNRVFLCGFGVGLAWSSVLLTRKMGIGA